MNYLEAVRALDDGECKKIKSSGGACYEKNLGGVIVFTGTGRGILLSPSIFLDEWSLIGVKQKAVFTGVKWHSGANGNAYPTVMEWKDFQVTNKPEMKMTLEWVE